MEPCTLCPRHCSANRETGYGFCGSDSRMRVARVALHPFEEPCLSGGEKGAGAGTIFFVGCPLHCLYCQNRAISLGGEEAPGVCVTPEELQRLCFSLKERGALNLDLVTPMQYAPQIRKALLPIRESLGLPVVCNTGGYDSPEQIALMRGVVDVYLPDYKYAPAARDLARRFSGAEDYPEVAETAIRLMYEQVGTPAFSRDGRLLSGVLVRHLVLPGYRRESIAALHRLRELFSPEDILLSLMSQYTPLSGMPKPLNRTVTTFEYQSVLAEAQRLGFQGYSQNRTSAKTEYTPPFDLSGLDGL